ncbi:hypothetical protein ACRALDRAFT_211704 [Sodiomyces alcalophilus JCM 7366]|uniref:uncharacterized protein n=1 Tax=Sodiomyces alcalophilus JCM 7366 TaxID=591952 RepID=UPI0039B5C71E
MSGQENMPRAARIKGGEARHDGRLVNSCILNIREYCKPEEMKPWEGERNKVVGRRQSKRINPIASLSTVLELHVDSCTSDLALSEQRASKSTYYMLYPRNTCSLHLTTLSPGRPTLTPHFPRYAKEAKLLRLFDWLEKQTSSKHLPPPVLKTHHSRHSRDAPWTN